MLLTKLQFSGSTAIASEHDLEESCEVVRKEPGEEEVKCESEMD